VYLSVQSNVSQIIQKAVAVAVAQWKFMKRSRKKVNY